MTLAYVALASPFLLAFCCLAYLLQFWRHNKRSVVSPNDATADPRRPVRFSFCKIDGLALANWRSGDIMLNLRDAVQGIVLHKKLHVQLESSGFPVIASGALSACVCVGGVN